MKRIRAARLRMCAAWALLCLIPLGCGATSLDQDVADEGAMECGPHARPRHRTVVATTTTPHGEVIDWIPMESQVPNGQVATPPPAPPPAPSGYLATSNPSARTSAKGPPGTVPVVRTRSSSCECIGGAVQRADGECVPRSEHCVGEGGQASAKAFTYCCSDLVPIQDAAPAAGGSCEHPPPDVNVCTRCGDGTCGAGESICNCPGDCGSP